MPQISSYRKRLQGRRQEAGEGFSIWRCPNLAVAIGEEIPNSEVKTNNNANSSIFLFNVVFLPYCLRHQTPLTLYSALRSNKVK
ncbi:MAG: hypothetical protein F6K21_13280 [Symploca sp. SIO2D2]|nr:hypothetical protein [Symploca sp. SIO2D2]NER50092.1 hypothetical protein [Symploca sp. SIO1A3]